MLANTPQFALSFFYVLYNNLFTSMHITKEHFDFVLKPSSLRVSHPEGVQRSTYWLQLPLKYSIPLMVVVAAAHWLLSVTWSTIDITLQVPQNLVPANPANDFEQNDIQRTYCKDLESAAWMAQS